MLIREMKVLDLDIVETMEKTLYKIPWNKKQFLYEVNENEFSFPFVVEEKNEIIGYYIFWKLFEEANLVKISVAKEYQGRGISHILLEDCLKRVKALDCEKVFLEVRTSNKKAIELYKKHGFIKTSIRKGYYDDGEDALILEKRIEGEENG